jgi:hypothetical protein
MCRQATNKPQRSRVGARGGSWSDTRSRAGHEGPVWQRGRRAAHKGPPHKRPLSKQHGADRRGNGPSIAALYRGVPDDRLTRVTGRTARCNDTSAHSPREGRMRHCRRSVTGDATTRKTSSPRRTSRGAERRDGRLRTDRLAGARLLLPAPEVPDLWGGVSRRTDRWTEWGTPPSATHCVCQP